MTASSVTGKGLGSSGKPTTTELAALSNSPAIFFVGAVASAEIGEEEFGGTVTLPVPLPGEAEEYAVLLTSVRGGWAEIYALNGTSTHFTDFEFRTSDECDEVQFMVVKRGHRLV